MLLLANLTSCQRCTRDCDRGVAPLRGPGSRDWWPSVSRWWYGGGCGAKKGELHVLECKSGTWLHNETPQETAMIELVREAMQREMGV